ncbi:hypothetical protein [Dyella mobilis]|uniref:Uncharacterized protein n=1 Tax=Dyella mobilis TaxID=1849582 RepID=A0ABS2KIN4_9GAMM|nr:hypothetical protein [Dyella mobilis]MBM7130617.1 hypothetical protein [Dyella mobilis]GLQ97244.1 hypothetical protein GCM10007863_16640 [Dyella mobilis]
MRNALFVLGSIVASQSASAASACYVDFINRGDDSVVSIELATPGQHDWKPVALRGVTNGGWVSDAGGYVGDAMVGIDVERGYVYDVLVEFATEKALLVKAFDVCHVHALDIDKVRRQARPIS